MSGSFPPQSIEMHSGESSSTPVGGLRKRLFDVIAALTMVIVLSPLILCVAALIFVTDGRPILIRHNRVGFGGKQFPCFKFRTMVVDAQEALAAYLDANPRAMDEWKQTQKLKHDPRITPVGRVLRQLSVDELPQLVNIIEGHMSVVGPRPIVECEMDKYGVAIDHYLAARPGLTGLWQVSGRSNTAYETRVTCDCEYVEGWSMGRDIQIIARTIPAVLRAQGTY